MRLLDHWREYEAEKVDRTIPIIQRLALEHAFYAGAAVTIAQLTASYDRSKKQGEKLEP